MLIAEKKSTLCQYIFYKIILLQMISCAAHGCDILVDDETVMLVNDIAY